MCLKTVNGSIIRYPEPPTPSDLNDLRLHVQNYSEHKLQPWARCNSMELPVNEICNALLNVAIA